MRRRRKRRRVEKRSRFRRGDQVDSRAIVCEHLLPAKSAFRFYSARSLRSPSTGGSLFYFIFFGIFFAPHCISPEKNLQDHISISHTFRSSELSSEHWAWHSDRNGDHVGVVATSSPRANRASRTSFLSLSFAHPFFSDRRCRLSFPAPPAPSSALPRVSARTSPSPPRAPPLSIRCRPGVIIF